MQHQHTPNRAAALSKDAATIALKRELQSLHDRPLEGFKVTCPDPNENVFKWNVVIFGPPETPYQGGYFKALLEFPDDYPFAPPTMTFKPTLYHPNIYEDGKVCISILRPAVDDPAVDDPTSGESLDERWKPVLGVRGVLLSVVSLLCDPNPSSSAHLEAGRDYRAYTAQTSDAFLEHVKKDVQRSREEAKRDNVVVPETREEYVRTGVKETSEPETSLMPDLDNFDLW